MWYLHKPPGGRAAGSLSDTTSYQASLTLFTRHQAYLDELEELRFWICGRRSNSSLVWDLKQDSEELWFSSTLLIKVVCGPTHRLRLGKKKWHPRKPERGAGVVNSAPFQALC